MRPSSFQNNRLEDALTPEQLRQDNQYFKHTDGISENNHDKGFHSAFLDIATGYVYLSRFSDGSPAPLHLLDGLPNELVLQRNAKGSVTAVKQTVIAGFLYHDRFYTREQAAQLLDNPDYI
jgi:DNA mismatch repair ATPase MutS